MPLPYIVYYFIPFLWITLWFLFSACHTVVQVFHEEQCFCSVCCGHHRDLHSRTAFNQLTCHPSCTSYWLVQVEWLKSVPCTVPWDCLWTLPVFWRYLINEDSSRIWLCAAWPVVLNISGSSGTAWPRMWRICDPLKDEDPISHQHSVIPQNLQQHCFEDLKSRYLCAIPWHCITISDVSMYLIGIQYSCSLLHSL
jgi:hypothetical protein